ncbi:MAG: hypothetical protein A2909_00715 [Candidatus Tagabacteria bacterium RIFCSPLOWO2_01_FULL_39_11]|uniref:Uncharacterized protein n=1 Tax=Candidatus Tagabacteria bacterium RIFCSPLOWO2_01_FULL_39_11 TaxID=1802295 RepID=A0A1G2LPP4_9BACT|nr:MAG: hypothetical protein A2909_00715 [Candidatus Tagabacteria bacterium RIFCSPLOWO2_01_FULL_39_11]
MKKYFKKLFFENTKIRKIIGIVLVFIGFAALLTPFTPGSWLIFVGLELLGLRFLLWEKIKQYLKNKRYFR